LQKARVARPIYGLMRQDGIRISGIVDGAPSVDLIPTRADPDSSSLDVAQRLERNHYLISSSYLCTMSRGRDAGAVRDVVGIRCGAISGNMKVSFQAARSIG
jgi:hypothetical protein